MITREELEAVLMMLDDLIERAKSSNRTSELNELLGARDEVQMALINLRNKELREAA